MNRARRVACSALASAIAAIGFQLAGCGYRLGGAGGDRGLIFRPAPAGVAIEGLGRYESFRKRLVTTLRDYGVRIVSPRNASARLVFSGYDVRRRLSVVGDDAKAREYLLTAEVSFSVVSVEGSEVLLPERVVRAEAAYLAEPARPLLTASERRAVMNDVEAELCRKIVQRLAGATRDRDDGKGERETRRTRGGEKRG